MKRLANDPGEQIIAERRTIVYLLVIVVLPGYGIVAQQKTSADDSIHH